MSYDLFFCVPEKRKPVSEKDFRRYFDRRQHYKKAPRQAWYDNSDTGVYFSFDYGPPVDPDLHAPIGVRWANISFNLNYMRPHAFSLEAEPEVAALVHSMDLQVEDPQTDGMNQGQYSSEGFLRGWNTGSRFSYAASSGDTDSRSRLVLNAASSAEIELVWRWNLARATLDSALPRRDVFVPRVAFLRTGNGLASAVVWGDAVAIALPPVRFLALGRDEYAPGSLDWCVVPYDRAASILSLGERVDSQPVSYHLFDYDRPPAELREFFTLQPPISGQPEFVAFEQVVTLELLPQTGT